MLSQNRPVIFNYQNLPTFFKKKVQPLIRAECKSSCVLCHKPLGPDEGVCVPILQDMRMKLRTSALLYAKEGDCDMKAISNGDLACSTCLKFLADPDSRDYERMSVLIPCQQILDYLASVFPTLPSKDLATRMQTVDQLLEDLENYPSSSPERRAAAPFLHCYQLQPVRELIPRYPKEFSNVVLYDPPACTVIDGRSYRIFDTAKIDTSVPADKRLSNSIVLPLYEQTASDVVTLWHLPRRSAGCSMGCAATLAIVQEVGDTKLCRTFWLVFFLSTLSGRGVTPAELNPAFDLYTPESLATRPVDIFFPLPPSLELASSSQGSSSVNPPGLERLSLSEGLPAPAEGSEARAG
ncbi:hypothetical protein PENSPDRAFT_671560 [Peniophora sp. CONT]|nr:hypothetical protein PENSPDRAFT_671560 [Peniophora sp. CONT]